MRPAMEQIKDRKDLVGAEIGVWKGDNAFEILNNLSIKKLYLVDPYVPYHDTGAYFMDGKGEGEATKEEARKRLETFGNRVWIYEPSLEAAKQVEDNSLDFVYIDGNHQYEFVRDDIQAWTPKVKEGGLVGGHDSNLEDVSTAVLEYCAHSEYKPYTFHLKKDENFWKAIADKAVGEKIQWEKLKELVEKSEGEFVIPTDWWFWRKK